MPLPDPDHSRAVLIGTANYRHLEPLPAVARNIEGLASVLRHPDGWGLPREHLTVVFDPPSADALLEAVHRAARAATDTLLIYYAGHALAGDDLLLTLPGSDTERLFRSVRFSDVRREIAPNRKKAVILDCAYQGPPPELDVPGGWLLAAGPGNELAPAPHHSAFTGELLTVLARGVPGGPETIDTDTLFLRVRHQLRAKQRPEPRQRGHGRLITLARNRAPETTTEPVTEEVDEQPYLQMTPAVLAESVSNLRAQGGPDKAVAALAACGRRRPDQEVAAIMTALAGLRRPADVASVAFAAAGRDPHDLRRIYEILVELDQRALAIGLLKVVAVGLPERTARFVSVLDGTTAPAGGDPVPALLRAAVAAAKQRPGRVIDLLDALLIDRREAAAELALGEAERVLPAADLAVIADALRDGGRDEQAYRLYAKAAEAVVRRDPAAVAGIVAALPVHVGRSVARQAVAVRVQAPPEHLAALLSEFEAAGLDDAVADAVAALSNGLARPALDQVTRLLRDRDRAGIALRLSLAAVADRPVDDILRLTESLNEQGRPVDALNLLTHAAEVRSIADLDRLTATGGPAARRIFAAVAGQAPGRVAEFARALSAAARPAAPSDRASTAAGPPATAAPQATSAAPATGAAPATRGGPAAPATPGGPATPAAPASPDGPATPAAPATAVPAQATATMSAASAAPSSRAAVTPPAAAGSPAGAAIARTAEPPPAAPASPTGAAVSPAAPQVPAPTASSPTATTAWATADPPRATVPVVPAQPTVPPRATVPPQATVPPPASVPSQATVPPPAAAGPSRTATAGPETGTAPRQTETAAPHAGTATRRAATASPEPISGQPAAATSGGPTAAGGGQPAGNSGRPTAAGSGHAASATSGRPTAAGGGQPTATGGRPAAAGGGSDGRWEQFRGEVLRRPDGVVVEVAAALVEAGALPPADDLLRSRVKGLAVAAVAAKRPEVVRRLLAVAGPDELPAVVRAVLDGFPGPGDAESRLAALLPGLPRRAIAETVAFVTTADDGRRKQVLRDAIAARPVADIVTVAAAVTRPDSAAAAHELLDAVAHGPVRRVAELVEELRRRGERAHVRALVEAFRVRHPDSPDVFKLAGWLSALDEHDVAALAVRGRLWAGEASVGDPVGCAVAELLHAYAVSSARLDLAYPALGESAAEELRRSYRLAGDEAFLLVLSSPKLRKPTPVLFTQRAVHHVSGEQLRYADLAGAAVSAGRRNAVVVERPGAAPGSWPMPTAAAAREVVELVGRIQALLGELHADGGDQVLEGEIS